MRGSSGPGGAITASAAPRLASEVAQARSPARVMPLISTTSAGPRGKVPSSAGSVATMTGSVAAPDSSRITSRNRPGVAVANRRAAWQPWPGMRLDQRDAECRVLDVQAGAKPGQPGPRHDRDEPPDAQRVPGRAEQAGARGRLRGVAEQGKHRVRGGVMAEDVPFIIAIRSCRAGPDLPGIRGPWRRGSGRAPLLGEAPDPGAARAAPGRRRGRTWCPEHGTRPRPAPRACCGRGRRAGAAGHDVSGTVRGGAVRGGAVRGGAVRGGAVRGGAVRGGAVRGGAVRGRARGAWLGGCRRVSGSRAAASWPATEAGCDACPGAGAGGSARSRAVPGRRVCGQAHVPGWGARPAPPPPGCRPAGALPAAAIPLRAGGHHPWPVLRAWTGLRRWPGSGQA